MDFQLTEEQQLFADSVHRFAKAHLEKGALARAHDHHARDGGIVGPGRKLRAHGQHHAMADGIERLRPVERDNAGCPAPLEQDVGRARVHCVQIEILTGTNRIAITRSAPRRRLRPVHP